MKHTIISLIIFAIAAQIGSGAELITSKRSEVYPGGKRYFTDYIRDNKLVLTKMTCPAEAKAKGFSRVEAYYTYFTIRPDGSSKPRAFPAASIMIAGNTISKSEGPNSLAHSMTCEWIDENGDGKDEKLRIIEHVNDVNNLTKSRLVEAYFYSPKNGLTPLSAEEILSEQRLYQSEDNG